jgi:hypothetical protein
MLVWLAQNCKRNARSGYREYKFYKRHNKVQTKL